MALIDILLNDTINVLLGFFHTNCTILGCCSLPVFFPLVTKPLTELWSMQQEYHTPLLSEIKCSRVIVFN